jgi:hypothetical protein
MKSSVARPMPITMPRHRLVAVAVTALIFAALTISSGIAAAPKRQQEIQDHTTTLTETARRSRLKAKSQTNPSGRYFHGFVSRFSAGQRSGVPKRPVSPARQTRQTTIINDM